MTTNVRFKFKDKQKSVSRNKLTELTFGILNVPLIRIFNTNDGYKAVCRNDDEADKLLNRVAVDLFDREGLSVVMPPEMVAKRSIIARGIDNHIGQATANEILENMKYHNEWMNIEEIIKFKDYSHVFKVRFAETSMADKAARDGFLIGNMSVTPKQIEREEFIRVQTCFSCYRYEQHQTRDCPENNDKVCSECSARGHTFRECNATHKKCINCTRQGKQETGHRTLAMACPIKKEIINAIRETQKKTTENKEQAKYATIVKNTVKEIQGETTTHIHLNETTHFKLLACIMHSHVLNLQTPGSYNIELNKMLKANNLPQMKFPSNPDSAKVLGATAVRQEPMEEEELESEEEKEETTTQIQVHSKPQRDPRIKDKGAVSKEIKVRKREETEEVEIQQLQEKQKKQKEQDETPTAKEINLRIHVKMGKGVPKNVTPESIMEGIKRGTMKYSYTNNKYSETYVHNLIKGGIILTTISIFQIYEEPKFEGMKNGYIKVKRDKHQNHV